MTLVKCTQCGEMKDDWYDAVQAGICKSCRLKNLWERKQRGDD